MGRPRRGSGCCARPTRACCPPSCAARCLRRVCVPGWPLDPARAEQYAVLAARQSPKVAFERALDLLDAATTRAGEAQAAEWLALAVQGPEPVRTRALALQFRYGLNAERDEAQAARLLRSQVGPRGGWAWCELIDVQSRSADPAAQRKALSLARTGTALGLPFAQAWLGYFYEQGELAPKDERRAAHWYAAAARAGHSWAQTKLGFMYQTGSGVAQNLSRAAELYQAAAEQQDAGGAFRLGWLYEWGQGVAPDAGQAVRWYTQAYEDGGSWAGQAALGLGRLAQNAGGSAAPEQAAGWYRRAAALGVQEARQALDDLRK